MSHVHSMNRRRGFTLIELLVVIAIIGVLVGLLLPSVTAVRDVGGRMESSRNLASLGMSLEDYAHASELLGRNALGLAGKWVKDTTIDRDEAKTLQMAIGDHVEAGEELIRRMLTMLPAVQEPEERSMLRDGILSMRELVRGFDVIRQKLHLLVPPRPGRS